MHLTTVQHHNNKLAKVVIGYYRCDSLVLPVNSQYTTLK